MVVHSLIIGMSLGASDFPSTVRPLVPALTFHQLFEGIGLGGCIVQVSRPHSFSPTGTVRCVQSICAIDFKNYGMVEAQHSAESSYTKSSATTSPRTLY